MIPFELLKRVDSDRTSYGRVDQRVEIPSLPLGQRCQLADSSLSKISLVFIDQSLKMRRDSNLVGFWR